MPVYTEEGFARHITYMHGERRRHAATLVRGSWASFEEGKSLCARIKTLDDAIAEAEKITGSGSISEGMDIT